MAKKSEPPTIHQPAPEDIHPQTPAEFSQRAWLFFSRGQLDAASSDMHQAIALEPGLDSFYALGLFLRANNKNVEALAAFEQALQYLPGIENLQRLTMLHRLLMGQINMIKTGDWNLEREVWNRLR